MPNHTRRTFLQAAGSGTLGLVLANMTNAADASRAAAKLQTLFVYVGTYTTGKSEGIYLYRLHLTTGELRSVGVTRGVVNPSYLVLDQKRRYLYAVNEVTEFNHQPGGAISSFAIDQQTGALRFLNQQPTRGGAPCYVSLDNASKHVLVANYAGGNYVVLPVRADGSLGATALTRRVPNSAPRTP